MPGLDPSYLEPILGVVFDLDGTLILSDHDFRKMRAAVVVAAEQHGVPRGTLAPGESVHATMETARNAFSMLRLPESDLLKFEADANRMIDAIELRALPTVRARPGAEALLAELTRRSYRLGLLTRSSEEFCRAALRATNLAGYFPTLRTRSSTGPSKPSPEALHLLLAEMEVPAHRALLVGDHLLDAQTASGAGVRFYGVLAEPPVPPWAPTLERLQAAGAKAVARDLAELARQLGLPPLPPARPAASERSATAA